VAQCGGRVSLCDKRIDETWRSEGFTPSFPRSPGGISRDWRQCWIFLGANARRSRGEIRWRVRSLSRLREDAAADFQFDQGVHDLRSSGMMDTEWSTTAQATYEKNPRSVAPAPGDDRTEAELPDALEDHGSFDPAKQFR